MKEILQNAGRKYRYIYFLKKNILKKYFLLSPPFLRNIIFVIKLLKFGHLRIQTYIYGNKQRVSYQLQLFFDIYTNFQ